MAPAWKASLVRARQAQEDLARGRLADAHTTAESAARYAAAQDDRVTSMVRETLPSVSIRQLIAAAEARSRAAASLVEARHAHALARDQILAQTVAVTAAAQARRSAEKMLERDELAAAAHLARVTQAELDELGSTRARRAA